MAEYHVENFGCRASRSDGEAIAADLRLRGINPASEMTSADVVIVNTCSVTADADKSARSYIRRVHRNNPETKIFVTGCYAQRAPEELARIEGVSAVVGNSHKSLVSALIEKPSDFVPVAKLVDSVPVYVDPEFAHADLAALPFAEDAGQTRPNLKVQEGCANRCSFCIIPETRGPSRSVALETCIESVQRFVDRGGQELVLSGINLGRWGRDLTPALRLIDLVKAILERTALPRLRLSSIEPMDWTRELLTLFASPDSASRLAHHAHLPLQSGSDAILRRMYRRYRPWHYAEKVQQLRAVLPDAAIGADVMAGFPGETDALFQQSYDFIAAQPFTYLHLFPFSPRPGTPAENLHGQQAVSASVVAERMDALRSLAKEKNLAFRRRFVGRELSVVTLKGGGPGLTPGLSSNFLKVEIATDQPANRTIPVRVTGLSGDGLLAEPVLS